MNEAKKIALLGTLLSKKYARDLMRLLKAYQDISSSEAASRLNLHVQTVQEFLEGLALLNLVSKEEIMEGKRPYFRYRLQQESLKLDFSLAEFIGEQQSLKVNENEVRIREKKNPGVQFTLGRGGNLFSTITVIVGQGRDRKQRRINLTRAQGEFLYYMPFPDAEPLSIDEIKQKSGVADDYLPEIHNLIEDLVELNVIELYR